MKKKRVRSDTTSKMSFVLYRFVFIPIHNTVYNKYSIKFDYKWKKCRWCEWDSNPDRRMAGADKSTKLWHL